MNQWFVAFSGWLVAGVLASRERDGLAVRLMRRTIELETLRRDVGGKAGGE